MQKNVFVDNLAYPANAIGTTEQSVAIQFTAFRAKAEAISKNAMKGDQLIVDYPVKNNDYKKNGETMYGYNFIVEDFTFGSPGKEKRDLFNRTGD